MSNFMRVGIFRIGLNRADLGCWRLTLRQVLIVFDKGSIKRQINFGQSYQHKR